MAIRFSTTDVEARLHGIKVLVYGRAGVGKTVLCSTAPDPIIISAESGLLSLGGVSIPVIVVQSLADLDAAYQYVVYDPDAKRRFRTVALDSITEIAETVLTVEKARRKDPRQAYGEMQDEVMKRIRWFRDIPERNVVMSAKMTSVTDQTTGVTLYGPRMPGQQLGPQLPYLFDEVFALEVGKDPTTNASFRYLRTKTDLQFDAKDRSGRLDEIEQPNLTHIFNKIQAGNVQAIGTTPVA